MKGKCKWSLAIVLTLQLKLNILSAIRRGIKKLNVSYLTYPDVMGSKKNVIMVVKCFEMCKF